jgi:hypothetical protein
VLLQDPHGDRLRAKALAEAASRDPASFDRAAAVCTALARDEKNGEEAKRLLRCALQANPRNTEAERELRALESRAAPRTEKPSMGGLPRKR